MSNFFSDIAREIGVLVRHNQNTIKSIEVAVGADATTLEAALVSVVNAFLAARGLTAVEPLADAIVKAMLGQLEQLVAAEAAKVVGQ